MEILNTIAELLAQAAPVAPTDYTHIIVTSVVTALGGMCVALVPVMLAVIAAYVELRKMRQESKASTAKIDKKIDHATEKIEEAAVTRQAIAITQAQQIDAMSKTGPQPVTVVNPVEIKK